MTLTHLAKDLQFSLRLLWKNPGFTLVAVLSLALGIGLNATVFTWCKAAILDPLPGVPDARSLILGFGATQSGSSFSMSYPDYLDLRNQNTSFEGLAVFRNLTVNLSQDGKTDRTWACLVSGNYLDVLHVKPLLGRTFLPEEDRTPATHPVVVMSYNLWQSRFQGNPNVIGSTLTINGKAFTVIGVTPKGFVGGIVAISQDLWIPMMMQEAIRPGKDLLTSHGNRWLQMVGRLKPGVTLAQAQANLKSISAQIEAANPNTNTNWSVALYPLTQSPEGASKILGPVLLLLMGIVSVVLLVACANVANLFMIKATNRRKEISIRIALGASRGRIISQLMVESLALSVISGVVGLFIAVWTAKSFLAMLPTQRLPIHLDCSIDQRVLVFTFGITLATGFLFGLIPALQATRLNQATTLKDEGSSVTLNLKQSKLRGSLVSLQVALSLVALITAGLFVRSVYNSIKTSPGFSVDPVFAANLDVFPNGYDQKRGKAFFTGLLSQVRTLPGVQAASLSRSVPLGSMGRSSTAIKVDNYIPRPEEDMDTEYNIVETDFFRTLGIQFTSGSDFRPLPPPQSDQPDPNRIEQVIVNETFVKRYLGEGNPLGRQINVNNRNHQIIGVVKDIKIRSMNEPPRPYMYLHAPDNYRSDFVLLVKTEGDPLTAAPGVKNIVAGIDPTIPIFDQKSLAEHTQLSLFPQRFAMIFLSIFGFLALGLAAMGLYGMMAYSVTQRTREIGIRMALGAAKQDIYQLILGRGLILLLIGMGLGVVGTIAVARLASSLLFGVTATDPITYLGVSLLLFGISFMACFFPAYRATRINPVIALRYE